KERNNDHASGVPVVIELPPPADLVIQDVSGPAEARPGEPASFTWTVRNVSNEPASGTWYDSLFVSTDGTWDVGDRLVGRVAGTRTLRPGEEYTSTLQTALPAVTPGSYRLILRTDIYNQVYEDQGDANNTTAAIDSLKVKATPLPLDSDADSTLTAG